VATENPSHPYSCAVCPRGVSRWQLMCPKHWFRVPEALRAEVVAAWRRFSYGIDRNTVSAREAYAQARQAAIDAVRPRRAAPAPTTTPLTTPGDQP
jgi:hypothetical protein